MSIKKYLGYNERKCRIIQNFLAGVVISHKIMNGLLKFAIVTSFKGPSLTYEYRYDFSMNQIFKADYLAFGAMVFFGEH